MLFTWILLSLSLVTTTGIFVGFNWYEYWYLYIVYVALIPIFYIVWAFITVIFLYIWSLFLNKKKEVTKVNKLYYFMVRQVCHQLDICSRTKVIINGEEKLPDSRFLAISNHLSMFDPIVIIDKFKHQPMICVTKEENEKIPVCGPFIHKAGFIALDRSNPYKAVASIKKACSFINSDSASIYICPEGTRSKNGELLPFHAGSFKIAYKSNVPIVVCNIKNTDLVHKNFPLKRTKVYVDILDVIYPEEFKVLNTNEMAEKCHEIILKFQKGAN